MSNLIFLPTVKGVVLLQFYICQENEIQKRTIHYVSKQRCNCLNHDL